MKILVYSKSGEDATHILDALRACGHEVRHRHPGHFAGARKDGDAALIVGCENKFEIVRAYQAVGVPSFTLDNDHPEIPGYPVAVFTEESLSGPDRWGFLSEPIPDNYPNPDTRKLVCSYYPAGPLVPALVAPKARPFPRITDFLHSQSLAEAPRVWIVGGGPSLRGFDWDSLHGEVVIGANRACECPNVGMVVTMDDAFQRWARNGEYGHEARERWENFPGLRFFSSCEKSNPKWGDVILAPRSNDDDHFPPTLDNFGKASNSGYAALKLAWAMGAKTIYCLGFDMGGEDGQQAWFHDGHPNVEPDSLYDEYRTEMDAAAPHLVADGVKVTICGPTTLTAFPTITLAEAASALSLKPLRPVVCGFYTRGTKYQQEAEAMARSAVAFGLDVSLVDVPNLGDWKANTDQKPEAIRFALERAEGRPIAFVDADARFRAYPEMFDYFTESNAEIALSFFDWDTFPDDPRTGKELSSAVMLLKPTDAVFALLYLWQTAVMKKIFFGGIEAWEQRVLQELLASGNLPNLKTMEIPMRYNQIFDHMSGLGLPVIEQMQASRRLKSEVAG